MAGANVTADPGPGHLIAADWLIAMDGRFPEPIRRGAVRVDADGVVRAVGTFDELLQPGDAITLLDSAVITPGLINAHAHLDMSYWQGHREPLAGRPLHEWVQPVAAERLLRPVDQVAESAAVGARASLAAGVTTVVDVTPAMLGWNEVLAAVGVVPIRRVALAEVLGFGERAEAVWTEGLRALAWGDQAMARRVGGKGSAARPATRQLLGVGLSPHAPYSTSAEVYARAVAETAASGRVLMTHLAETPEEVEFCFGGRGPWRKVLEKLAGPQDDLEPFACSPVRYVYRLGLLEHPLTLLAHVNYLRDGDLELLAGGKASVVYCPRSWAFFGHRCHPWGKLIGQGVNVAVGTDSPASAPDLSVLGELQFLRQRHPRVPAARLFALATVNAASAIGFTGRLGALAVDAYADLAVWPAPAGAKDAETILGGLIESCPAPRAVYVAGQAVG